MADEKQYTGYVDANLNPICEGDIIKHTDENIVWEVCLWDDLLDFMADSGQASGNFKLPDLIGSDESNFFIVGNVNDKTSTGYKMLIAQSK